MENPLRPINNNQPTLPQYEENYKRIFGDNPIFRKNKAWQELLKVQIKLFEKKEE